MKKVSMTIALAALLIVAGTAGLSAQNRFGGGYGGYGAGFCINNAALTAEQITKLMEMRIANQAEMTTLRNQFFAATTLDERLVIREKMNALRMNHQAKTISQLGSWGVNANQNVWYGRGRKFSGQFGNRNGMGRGMGRGTVRGMGMGMGMGRGL